MANMEGRGEFMAQLLVAVFLTFAFFAPPAPAEAAGKKQNKEEIRKIKKGFDVTVNSYDEATDTFLITINSEPDNGPNYVTPESFRQAIKYEGGKTDFNKQRAQMIGSVYALKKDLPLLELTDLAARKKK